MPAVATPRGVEPAPSIGCGAQIAQPPEAQEDAEAPEPCVMGTAPPSCVEAPRLPDVPIVVIVAVVTHAMLPSVPMLPPA